MGNRVFGAGTRGHSGLWMWNIEMHQNGVGGCGTYTPPPPPQAPFLLPRCPASFWGSDAVLGGKPNAEATETCAALRCPKNTGGAPQRRCGQRGPIDAVPFSFV